MIDLKNSFLDQLDATRYLNELFSESPDWYFFAKDLNSTFTLCNRALLDKLAIANEEDIVGTDDYLYFDRSLADKYREEDKQIFLEQKPITNRIWLVPNASGAIEWYLSSKYPLFDKNGKVIGLAGLMRDYQQTGPLVGSYKKMTKAINYIHQNPGESITVTQLAEMTHLSVSQFERSFKKLFNLTPIKYLNQVRLDTAARLLLQNDRSITSIAQDTGFYDHSYFTKQFKKAKGVTPAHYRSNAFKS